MAEEDIFPRGTMKKKDILGDDADVPPHDAGSSAGLAGDGFGNPDVGRDPRLHLGRSQDLPGRNPDARLEAKAEGLDSVGERGVTVFNSQS